MESLEASLEKKLDKILFNLSFNKDNEANLLMQSILESAMLDQKHIPAQSFPQLSESLNNIDMIISKFEKLSTSKSPFERMASLKYLSNLLDIKKLILDRIRNIRSDQEITDIVSNATQADTEALKEKLENFLETHDQQMAASLEIGVRKEKISDEILLIEADTAAFIKRSTVWKSFLEKESVSTIVGSLLAIIMAISIIIAMFLKIPVPQALNDVFLLIIGYFFGQKISEDLSKKGE